MAGGFRLSGRRASTDVRGRRRSSLSLVSIGVILILGCGRGCLFREMCSLLGRVSCEFEAPGFVLHLGFSFALALLIPLLEARNGIGLNRRRGNSLWQAVRFVERPPVRGLAD